MPERKQLVAIHAAASMTGILVIFLFFSSTLFVEITGIVEQITTVKRTIAFSLPLLLIAMPAAGISGMKLAGQSKNSIIKAKKKRLVWIVANGIVLSALAVTLFLVSRDGVLGTDFYILQSAELLLGGTNLTLMGMSVRDGLFLSRRLKKIKDNRPETEIF